MINKMPKSGRLATFWILLLSFIVTAPGLYLSLEDSEIWGITSSRRFLDEISTVSSAHIKPLFSLIFGTIVHLAPTDWDALFFSRVFTVGLAATGVFCLIRLVTSTYSSTHQRIASYALLGLTVATPVFLLHFTKARSDTVAVSLCLISLLLISLSQNKQRIFLLASTAVLLITPKSIDLVVALASFTWLTREAESNASRRLKQLTWLLSPMAVLFGLALIFSREPLIRALTYWLDSYSDSPFTSLTHWSHLISAARSGWIATALLTIGIFSSLYFFFSKARRTTLTLIERAFICSGLAVALFMLVHSQKYQFFIASRVPFLLMLALPGWVRLLDSTLTKITATRAALAGVAIVMTSFAFSINRIHREQLFSLDLQKTVHASLLSYLKRSEVSRYWDAIGLFPKQNRIFHYPSPGDRTNEDMPDFVESSRPAIVIRTPKMNLLEPYLFVWLQKKYAPISDEIHVRVAHLTGDQFSRDCTLKAEEILKRTAEEGLSGRRYILLVKTKTNTTWNQIPFRIQKSGNRVATKLTELTELTELAELNSETPQALEQAQSQRLAFIGCRDADTQYAVSETGPWKARPVSYNSTLFGYDGRL